MDSYKSPNEGGCWFCHKDGFGMDFSLEFDCFFHMDCLKKELEKHYNPEAEIMAYEFGISFKSKEPEECEGE